MLTIRGWIMGAACAAAGLAFALLVLQLAARLRWELAALLGG